MEFLGVIFVCLRGEGGRIGRDGREDGGGKRQKDAFLGHKVNTLLEEDRRWDINRLHGCLCDGKKEMNRE